MTAKELSRFLRKVRVSPFGCWQWLATQNGDGYGWFRSGGKMGSAHRAAYQHFIGPVPNGLQLDHLCRNRACVNPAHLEVVTCRENVLRGAGLSARNARKTYCYRGHKFTEGNTTVLHRKHGKVERQCRTCHRSKARRRHAKKAEVA